MATSSDGLVIIFARRSRMPKQPLTLLSPFRMNSLALTGGADPPCVCAWDFIEATPRFAVTITSEPSPIGRVGSKPAPLEARFLFRVMWPRWLS